MDDWQKLLLSFFRSDLPVDVKFQLRDLNDGGWKSLLSLAAKHNVTPMLYKSLANLSHEIRVPPDLQIELRKAYHRSAARNMRLYQQLAGLLLKFKAEEIPVILLKGAHLAQIIYGNIALRPMGDIDLLVKHEDLSKASAALFQQGYETSYEDAGRSLEHLPPFRKKGFFDVEIHFHIAAPPISGNFSVDELWERSRKETVQGVNVLTLCPEDLLIHLCLHATCHHIFDNGIRPLIDIYHTLNYFYEEFEWDAVITRSKHWKANKSLYVMLALSKKVLGASVPDWVLEKIIAVNPDVNVIESAQRLVFEQESPISLHVAKLMTADNWPERFRVFIDRAFPQRELMLLHDIRDNKKFSFYKMYFSRLKGILKRHKRSIWETLLTGHGSSETLRIQKERSILKDWFEKP